MIDKIWREIVTLEYVLTQGYSNYEVSDTRRLNDLRFLYDRLCKIKRIKDKL